MPAVRTPSAASGSSSQKHDPLAHLHNFDLYGGLGVRCYHDRPARAHKCKSKKNPGRWFYTCTTPLGKKGRCAFFQWEDQILPPPPKPTTAPASWRGDGEGERPPTRRSIMERMEDYGSDSRTEASEEDFYKPDSRSPVSSYRPDESPGLNRLSRLSRSSSSYRPAPYERDPFKADTYRPRPRLADRFDDLEDRLASIEATVGERRRPATPPLPSRVSSSTSSRKLLQRQTTEVLEVQTAEEQQQTTSFPSPTANLPASLARLKQKVADLEKQLESKENYAYKPRMPSEAPSERGAVAKLFSRMQV